MRPAADEAPAGLTLGRYLRDREALALAADVRDGEVLMANAAHQVAVATWRFMDGAGEKNVVAVAGIGNNGGDARGAIRHLRGWGARVEAYVAGPRGQLWPRAARQ